MKTESSPQEYEQMKSRNCETLKLEIWIDQEFEQVFRIEHEIESEVESQSRKGSRIEQELRNGIAKCNYASESKHKR
jgi:hypothetical protein